MEKKKKNQISDSYSYHILSTVLIHYMIKLILNKGGLFF